MSDATAGYNTKLNDADEQAFQAWVRKTGRKNDLADYDLRGAWKDGAQQAENGHFTDKYKKPNHPTFSDESIYSNSKTPGGKWRQDKGKWSFTPSQHNLDTYGASALQDYFKRAEPDSLLVMPQ